MPTPPTIRKNLKQKKNTLLKNPRKPYNFTISFIHLLSSPKISSRGTSWDLWTSEQSGACFCSGCLLIHGCVLLVVSVLLEYPKI